ncbi:YbaB/EbfC family nucleoid-associated protein [Martelella soudanensis]|uniref:YbaB/EbfC family nucleoid-associated protein n=1 Tax=unclassified Martelella TaxID=2629616 RepID=UPI0015DDB2AE|nr:MULTISPECIES: YbaB/EbfC family nucleoid-associated protein [unclassified Martelella]
MRDLMGMMGKVKEMQAKMEQLQEDIAAARVEGVSGGGMVTVEMTGKGELLSIKIDPTLLSGDDAEMLEDLIVAAHRDAKDRADEKAQEMTQEITAGLPIPPGMKLPF